MRHMYDSDGNIPYAGKVRVSRRWKSSQTRSERYRGTPRQNRPESKAAQVELDTRSHKERIAAILASSKWQHNYNEM